jgi:hypothetical protein
MSIQTATGDPNAGTILTGTPSGSYLTSSTGGNLIWSTSTGTATIDTAYYGWGNKISSKPLEDLIYNANFEVDKDNMLKNNINGLKKNKIFFRCDFINNRIQPYEFIMKLIEDKKQFSFKIDISDILSINYHNFRFTKIENNFDFKSVTSCDFSKLKVRFEYDKIEYENHRLSPTQLRNDKMKKIMRSNEESSENL